MRMEWRWIHIVYILDIILKESLNFLVKNKMATYSHRKHKLRGQPYGEMPNPSEEELKSDLFNALWQEIKTWDINVPEYYDGYCGGNGSHVKLLLDKLKPVLRNNKIDEILIQKI